MQQKRAAAERLADVAKAAYAVHREISKLVEAGHDELVDCQRQLVIAVDALYGAEDKFYFAPEELGMLPYWRRRD